MPAKDLQRIEQGDQNYEFETANGATIANQTIRYDLQGRMNETIHPMVLDSTLDLLSVGKRVLDKGYGYFWEPYCHRPVFLNQAHTMNYVWICDAVYPAWSKTTHRFTMITLRASMARQTRHGHSLRQLMRQTTMFRQQMRQTLNLQAQAWGGDPVDNAGGEIDEDCESDASKEELLRKAALSLDHLSTRFPKSPFCQYCQRCKAARVRNTR